MPPRKRKSGPPPKEAPRKEAPRKEAPAAGPPPVTGFTPGMAPECMMCPFGLFFFTLRSTRPEVMEHLMAAGQELFLAFKAVVDQTADRWEQAQTLQRISVR